MTAIALLNPENDPHIVADTMLTVDGINSDSKYSVWLPSLGKIKSQWGTQETPWYITRMGRKTFVLPNTSGILAFAGDCIVAFEFWGELSKKFLDNSVGDPNLKITRSMVTHALEQIDGSQISLLGVLIDNAGKYDIFVHRPDVVLKIPNIGTCYLAGSGTPLIQRIIEAHDKLTQATFSKNIHRTMNPTEDLAERISSQMLFEESHESNGTVGTSLDLRCGGFYEWYKLKEMGVPSMRSRLDLHFQEVDQRLIVNRAYFSEPMEIDAHAPTSYRSKKYGINILNLGLEPMELIQHTDNRQTLIPVESYGVLIESTFSPYVTGKSTVPLEGFLTDEILTKLFAEPVQIHRVRLFCTSSVGTIARSISRLREDQDELAIIYFRDSQLHIQLSDDIVLTVTDCLRRLRIPA